MMKSERAYQVAEGSEGEHVIVFAKSGVVARRIGAEMLQRDFSDIESCRRAKWADEYVDQPFIPAKAYHDAGWWMYCTCCGQVRYDDDNVIYDGPRIFCSNEKKERHEAIAAAERSRNEHP